MKKCVAFPAAWMFHLSPRYVGHTGSPGCLFPEGIHSLRNLTPNPLQAEPLLSVWNAFTAWRPAPGAREAQRSFRKRLTELQKAVTEPEGCQDEANMGRIYQQRSQRKTSKLALNMLWFLICSLQTSWCGATTLRLKSKAKEVIPLSTVGPIRGTAGLCGRILFTETGARACEVKTGERMGAAKWIRAQYEEMHGLWEREVEDPEDCRLEWF